MGKTFISVIFGCLLLMPAKETLASVDWRKPVSHFSFEKAEVLEVVRAMSQLTGKNFVVGPGVKGQLTIIQSKEVPLMRAYQAFLQAMWVAGFRVTDGDGYSKVEVIK